MTARIYVLARYRRQRDFPFCPWCDYWWRVWFSMYRAAMGGRRENDND